MEKTELGFVAIINIENYEQLSLCFKATKGDIKILDNNDKKNYIFQIERAPYDSAITKTNVAQSKKETETLDEDQNEKLMEKVENLSKKVEKLSKDIKTINSFIKEYKKFIEDNVNVSNAEKANKNISESEKIAKSNANMKNAGKNDENINIIDDNNTLLISEIQGKVFLPYKIEDLKEILKKDKDVHYNSIADLIKDKYVISIDKYRWPIISRYKETFKLMREKEKASITRSLGFALEFSVVSLLNPAIITACRNLNELDMYLYCLENDQLDQFDLFKIQYEMLPVLSRN